MHRLPVARKGRRERKAKILGDFGYYFSGGTSMRPIPLARCALLAPFTAILNNIGAPTDTMLARFHLPAHPAERPNDYFPLFPALRFATAAQTSQGISDFGFLAVQQLHLGDLSEQLQTAVRHSPTLLVALQQWCRFVQLEDTLIRFWLEPHERSVRLCNAIPRTAGMLHLEHTQWVQNLMPIAVIRTFAGANWAPETIAFEAHYTPSVETQSLWPNTRFLSGQKSSWIDVPNSQLGLPNPARNVPHRSAGNEYQPIGTDTVTALKLLLPSYLDERVPNIAAVAEIAGTSVRTLQRELTAVGLTYSDLLDQVRFEKAVRLLDATDAKIIDVAFATGYADPAHFARAFRRIAGVTPREFRENSQAH